MTALPSITSQHSYTLCRPTLGRPHISLNFHDQRRMPTAYRELDLGVKRMKPMSFYGAMKNIIGAMINMKSRTFFKSSAYNNMGGIMCLTMLGSIYSSRELLSPVRRVSI